MKKITKPWYVRIKQIVSTAEGMIYGLGSNGKMYLWHHSLEYRGKWVIHIRVTEEEATTKKIKEILKDEK